MAEYVVLDFETANPKRVRACAVGGCVISDDAIVDQFSTLIKPPPDDRYVDVCELAKAKLSGLKNYKLPTVAKHLGIEPFKHHDAVEDAVACARVFLALNGQCEPTPPAAKEITSTDEMTEGEVQAVFKGFVDCITDDGVVDYKEATELFYFLAIMPQTKMVRIVRDTLFDVLADDVVDQYESERLIAQLQYATSHLFDR